MVRCMKHWVVYLPCNGQNLCETVATAVGESWNLGLLSVTRWSDLFCKRFVRRALCYTAQCFIDLSRRFRKDFGTVCVTDFTVHQDLVMDTSVYLVSYDGLPVKTTTLKTVTLSLYFRFYCVKKKIKNLADPVPACGGVSTVHWVSVSSAPHQYSNFKILVCLICSAIFDDIWSL